MKPLTVQDLSKYLGPGLGLRKSKYLLEIPMPGIEGAKINVLARSAGFPERNITTSSLYHKGRKYNVRGETDYGSTYEVSIVDDSNMDIRRKFDEWLRIVDDSKPQNAGLFSGASYEASTGAALDMLKSGLGVANQIKRTLKNPVQDLGNFFMGSVDPALASPTAKYQTDINVWQLAGNGQTVYGYKLQNVFPSQIGIVTLDDGNINTLSEFNITFTFSEFIPLNGTSVPEQIFNTLLGTQGQNVLNGIQSVVK